MMNSVEGHFCGVITGNKRAPPFTHRERERGRGEGEKGMWVKVQPLIKVAVVASVLFSPRS